MPEEVESQEAEEVVEEEKSTSPMKKIMLFATLGLVALMALFYVKQSGLLQKFLGEKEAKPKPPLVYTFEQQFLVNLADEDVLRYVKVVLGVSTYDQKVIDEIKKRMVEVRDAIILVISSRKSEELLKPEGKKKLKNDIVETLNNLLSSGKVEQVYFVDFVMQ